MKSLCIFLLLLGVAIPFQANDYTSSTNLAMKGVTPWPVAIALISFSVPKGEERAAAVRSLVHYKSIFLVRYLVGYSRDTDPAVRVASVWPLYKNGEKERVYKLVKDESEANLHALSMAFWIPNEVGGGYKLTLIKDDIKFKQLIEDIALNPKIDSTIRIHAAIYLLGLKKRDLAVKVAKEIKKTLPGEKELNALVKDEIKANHQWPEIWYLNNDVDWCLKLAEDPYVGERVRW